VTAGNVGDAAVAGQLLTDCLTPDSAETERPEVFGDAAYGTGALLK
jgi:hypothetical protein